MQEDAKEKNNEFCRKHTVVRRLIVPIYTWEGFVELLNNYIGEERSKEVQAQYLKQRAEWREWLLNPPDNSAYRHYRAKVFPETLENDRFFIEQKEEPVNYETVIKSPIFHVQAFYPAKEDPLGQVANGTRTERIVMDRLENLPLVFEFAGIPQEYLAEEGRITQADFDKEISAVPLGDILRIPMFSVVAFGRLLTGLLGEETRYYKLVAAQLDAMFGAFSTSSKALLGKNIYELGEWEAMRVFIVSEGIDYYRLTFFAVTDEKMWPKVNRHLFSHATKGGGMVAFEYGITLNKYQQETIVTRIL